MLSKLSLVLLLSLGLSACSKLPSFLLGGGPSVSANVQAGKTNTQTVGQTVNEAAPTANNNSGSVVQTTKDNNRVASDKVESVTINEIPAWIILLLVIGWLLPTPQEMVRDFINLFRRKK